VLQPELLQLLLVLSTPSTLSTTTNAPPQHLLSSLLVVLALLTLLLILLLPQTLTIQSGKYTGFPRLGTGLQFLESPALRASLGMLDNEDMTGVMISDVDATAPAAAVLQPGDVVLSVDGIKVSNNNQRTLAYQPYHWLQSASMILR
jgi:PDZ domain